MGYGGGHGHSSPLPETKANMIQNRLPRWPDRDKVAQDSFWTVNIPPTAALPLWRRLLKLLRTLRHGP
jgi:hypothetical protein